MKQFNRLFSPASYVGLTILNILFVFVMLSEPLGDAAESLMIKMAAPFQAKYLYDNPENSLAYDFQSRSREYWSQDKILLLTLDDLEVQSTGTPYPFSYVKYANDIRMAYQLEAKAIFIDLLITDERGKDSGIEYLLNTICEINESTPVFLASTRFSGQNFDPTPIHPVLAAHSNFQQINPVCFQEVSVSLAEISGEHKYWYYPLFETNQNATETDPKYLPSAGLAIYNHFSGEYGTVPISPNTIGKTDELMAMTWGATPATFNVAFEHDRRVAQGESFCRESKNALEYLSFLPFLSHQFEDKELPLCPYFPETRPGFLAGLDSSDQKGKQVAQELVKDSLVIYSVNLTGVRDIVNSPVHGTISGAHYHAMAFHNIDRFGPQYIKRVELEFSNLFNWTELSVSARYAVIILVLMIIVATVISHGIRHAISCKSQSINNFVNTHFIELSPPQNFLVKLLFFVGFLGLRFALFVGKAAIYIGLACGVVIGLSQFIVLDPFIWIEAATLVTLLFASNAIISLFELFIDKTSEQQERNE